ncbi:hypothetical protein HanRHA438_Chr04g0193741 [Helianthus annuus]|nr:hypothetical protein HanRHA438_Chr04g0193741 [Helianthus annuus]KAJ0932766.1 hypothetical protein HanPSC8_Chr04g0177411 [Helianthus annuus]
MCKGKCSIPRPPRIKRVQRVHQYHILPLFHHNVFGSLRSLSQNHLFS